MCSWGRRFPRDRTESWAHAFDAQRSLPRLDRSLASWANSVIVLTRTPVVQPNVKKSGRRDDRAEEAPFLRQGDEPCAEGRIILQDVIVGVPNAGDHLQRVERRGPDERLQQMQDRQRRDDGRQQEVDAPMRRVGADMHPRLREMAVDLLNPGTVHEYDEDQEREPQGDFLERGRDRYFIHVRQPYTSRFATLSAFAWMNSRRGSTSSPMSADASAQSRVKRPLRIRRREESPLPRRRSSPCGTGCRLAARQAFGPAGKACP